jgi:hypothetical protein
MAWTGLPATNATDWSAVGFYNQFLQAVRERIDAAGRRDALVGISSLEDREAGDDVQTASPINLMQIYLEALAPYYLDPASLDPADIDPSLGASFPIFTQADSAGWFWTWAEVLAEAGLNAAGWQRKYPREIETTGDAGSSGQRAYLEGGKTVYAHDGSSWVVAADQTAGPDVITDYGEIEPGDYIGPHIWNELKAVCEVYRYRVFVAPAQADGGGAISYDRVGQMFESNGRQSSGGSSGTSWPAARLSAETSYDASVFQTPRQVRAALNYTTTLANRYRSALAKAEFGGDLNIGGGELDLDAVVDLYLWAEKLPSSTNIFAVEEENTFEGYGYAVVEDAFAVISAGDAITFAAGAGTSTAPYSPFAGVSATRPAWPVDPAATNGHYRQRGFTANVGGPTSQRLWSFAVVDFGFTQKD